MVVLGGFLSGRINKKKRNLVHLYQFIDSVLSLGKRESVPVVVVHLINTSLVFNYIFTEEFLNITLVFYGNP